MDVKEVEGGSPLSFDKEDCAISSAIKKELFYGFCVLIEIDCSDQMDFEPIALELGYEISSDGENNPYER